MAEYSFLFKELITCGAVLSTFELVEELRKQGKEANIVSSHTNRVLSDYFKIEPLTEARGIKIAVSPKCVGEYAYVRTRDGRWLNHQCPKIAVSKFIAEYIGADVIIGNGTHERFKDLGLKRDIDVLIEGNDEDNKNIDETIREAKKLGKKIVWFGRQTREVEGVENISNPSIEEIPILYNRAKVFLKKSKCEGWGRPIAEATACGCKVINLSGGNKKIKVEPWSKIAKQLINYLDETN